MVKAEIISVGTELLLGQIQNTNTQFLAAQLAELGLALYFQTVVGDNEPRLQEVFLRARERAQVVILTGGLGPTEDDITREAVAKALGRKLVHQPALEEQLRHIFTGREMPGNNLRQAYLPEGGVALPNANGTAPGIWIKAEQGQMIFLLPGPPREMQPMFVNHIIPILKEHGFLHGRIYSRTLHFVGISESKVAELLSDIIATQTVPTIALYSRIGEVDVRLTAYAHNVSDAQKIIEPCQTAILTRLAKNFYGVDDCTLARAVGQALLAGNHQLAAAESCTGGLLGHLLTAESGSSAYFLGSVVCYANEAKVQILGVSEETLRDYGAVSEQCAGEMLHGALRIFGASAVLAITGIAGPLGGTPSKPVGTVWIAVGCHSRVRCFGLRLPGDRAAVKERAARVALWHLLTMLREESSCEQLFVDV